ncbi:hypothetical protein TNCV_1627521 [Trichonephila clavipes]|nr:hypothetical protein TNCV_1627521 [Trichonephila clavipes]
MHKSDVLEWLGIAHSPDGEDGRRTLSWYSHPLFLSYAFHYFLEKVLCFKMTMSLFSSLKHGMMSIVIEVNNLTWCPQPSVFIIERLWDTLERIVRVRFLLLRALLKHETICLKNGTNSLELRTRFLFSNSTSKIRTSDEIGLISMRHPPHEDICVCGLL